MRQLLLRNLATLKGTREATPLSNQAKPALIQEHKLELVARRYMV